MVPQVQAIRTVIRFSSLVADIVLHHVEKRKGSRNALAATTLCLALFSSPNAAGAADSSVIDSAKVSRLISSRLADEGLEGAPSLAADRMFPACSTPLLIEPMFGGWNTVTVRCAGASKWRFAIRTNLKNRPAPVPVRDFRPNQHAKGPIETTVAVGQQSSQIVDEVEVVALARSVSRNDMIAREDLIMVPVSARNAFGAFFDPADVAGRRLKMGLSAHKPVMARHLYPDYLVEEGNEVLITSSSGGISINMVGYALENGQISEWIGVKNASSGKTIRAKITGEKKVKVIAKN